MLLSLYALLESCGNFHRNFYSSCNKGSNSAASHEFTTFARRVNYEEIIWQRRPSGKVSFTKPSGSEFESPINGRDTIYAGLVHIKSGCGQMYTHWCGLDICGGGCQLSCCLCHLIGVQNYEFHIKIVLVLFQNETLI